VGISRFGTSIDTAARMALHHYGLEAMKDVMLVQVGAVSSGLASFAVAHTRSDLVLSAADSSAPRRLSRAARHRVARGSLRVRRDHRAQEFYDAASRCRDQLCEIDPRSTARIKRDKAFTIDMMMKYFRTKDREMMEETYEVSVIKYLKRVPTPTAESFRTVVDELAMVNPKAKAKTPNASTTIVFCRNWTRVVYQSPKPISALRMWNGSLVQ
jgi:hypothetical protein